MDSQIAVGGMKVQKIPDQCRSFRTERNDELAHSVPVIVAHDMPEDCTAADFDQRLGRRVGLLRRPDAKPSRENCHGRKGDAMGPLAEQSTDWEGSKGRHWCQSPVLMKRFKVYDT